MATEVLKLAVVTGASRGLGRAMAIQLAYRGYHIIAIGRDIEQLETLDDHIQGSMTIVPLDLLDYPAIYRLAKALHERFGKRLDLLIGCAATLPLLTLIHHYSPLEWETAMGVNCTAHWHLTRAFYPLLKENPSPAKAIFITDHTAYPAFWGAYRVSKRALEEMVAVWQRENQASHVSFHVLSPPPMRTKLRQQAMPGVKSETLADPEDVARSFLGTKIDLY